jgi:hypothetical protein
MVGISGYNEVKKTEVSDMFHRKADKRIVELSAEEARLARCAMLSFRNKLIEQGKPTEDVNELLVRLLKG